MELINRTSLAAALSVGPVLGAPRRFGMVVAKATFRIHPDGSVTAETAEPIPLFDDDQETELGLFPRDNLPRMDLAFEVILLGSAHAQPGYAVSAMTAALSVGRVRRELAVFGDREWVAGGIGAPPQISPPQPFQQMPLSYTRAFGGTCEVLIDVESPVDVSDAVNPAGRGFDPAPLAKRLAEGIGVPAGYPRFDPRRLLPNLEHPQQLIRSWSDTPRPYTWATVPLSSVLHVERGLVVDPNAADPDVQVMVSDGFYHRAHPDWVIDLPEPEAVVTLYGLTAGQPVLSFRLPLLRVLGDYIMGSESGTFELAPQMLVLLPDEMRFYLVYRRVFGVPFVPEQERSMRLRTEPGWFSPSDHVR
jgi:hypothetical protein